MTPTRTTPCPGTRAAHQRAVAAVTAHAAQVTAWGQADDLAHDGLVTWSDAKDDFATAWNSYRGDIVATTANLISGAAGAVSLESQTLRLRSQAGLYQQMHDTATANLTDAVDPATGKLCCTSDQFYQDLDTARLSQAVADDSADALRPDNLKIDEGVARASIVLGVAATGYGIYADMQDGEPADEAITSNVGGTVAGAAAGWAVGVGAAALEGTATGAALGSAVPVVGTIVGAVVGVVVTEAIADRFEDDDGTQGAPVRPTTGTRPTAQVPQLAYTVTDVWEAIFPEAGTGR